MTARRLDNQLIDELRGVLPEFGFSDQTKITFVSSSENVIYLLEDLDKDAKFVARVNSGRPSYHKRESVASEMMWLMAIRNDTSIIVPEVLIATDGSLVKTISNSVYGMPRCVAVYSLLEGEEPKGENLALYFEQLGRITARLHEHAKTWRQPTNFSRHSWVPETIFKNSVNLADWRNGVDIDANAVDVITRVYKRLRKRLYALSMEKSAFGLVHSDLRLAYLLIKNNETAVIDFDDCGFGWFLYDLAGALTFIEDRPDVDELIDRWLIGYRTVALLPESQEAEIPTFIMLRRIMLIGWVGSQVGIQPFADEIGSEYTRNTLEKAETYLTTHG